MKSKLALFAIVIAGGVVVVGCAGGRQPPPGTAVPTSIEVQPPSATIAIDNGAPATPVGFAVVAKFADGHSETLTDATLALDLDAQLLGTLAGAQFTAGGGSAGTGHLTAQARGKSAMATVTVTVHQVHLGTGVPPDASGTFGPNPVTGPQSPFVVYPLDGVVMPSSVKAPDVQWESGGGASGMYRVRLTAGGASVESILSAGAGFTFDWQPSLADWSLLVNSAGTQPISVSVDHWDATSGAQGGAAVRINMVRADVGGVIYYWDLSEGKMQRIDETGRMPAIPKPPVNPADAANRCVACHVVSRDGRYLAGELWGGGMTGAVFDLSDPKVRSGDPAPTVMPVNTYNSLFSTFNADATRLLVNNGSSLSLVDPKTGMSLPAYGPGLPTANAAHPTWSPDGTLVAFVNNIASGSAVDYTTGDLQLIGASAGDTFTAPMPLVSNSTGDPAFKAPSWPTFSPDSQWIAYAAGVNSRARLTNQNGTVTDYPGALFMISRSGGTAVRLDNACAAARNCFLPNFSPYDAGGYYWMVFYSLRDYGNAQVGTKNTKRRQMWVTAIDKSKVAAGDASQVPYWLPDQDAKTDNMSAFWAVPPPLQ
ncbi:MAG: hypothetical protein JWN44_1941 [Myxococcales bacterium]|nr:hypothetical protein [Myxococcales bacterium]